MPEALTVDAGEPDVPPLELLLDARGVGDLVGLDHLRLAQSDHPRRGLATDRLGNGLIDDRHLFVGEHAAERGHLAGHPHLALEVAHATPGQRQPVLEIERVGHHGPRSERVHPAGDRELAQRELLHTRCAVAAEALETLPTRRLVVGPVRVQHAPVQHQLEVVDLGLPPTAQHVLEGSKRAARVEVADGGRHAASLSNMCSKNKS